MPFVIGKLVIPLIPCSLEDVAFVGLGGKQKRKIFLEEAGRKTEIDKM